MRNRRDPTPKAKAKERTRKTTEIKTEDGRIKTIGKMTIGRMTIGRKMEVIAEVGIERIVGIEIKMIAGIEKIVGTRKRIGIETIGRRTTIGRETIGRRIGNLATRGIIPEISAIEVQRDRSLRSTQDEIMTIPLVSPKTRLWQG